MNVDTSQSGVVQNANDFLFLVELIHKTLNTCTLTLESRKQ